MSVYTYTSARQNLAQILDEAATSQQVFIRRKNGQLFQITPVVSQRSGLDVPAVKTDTNVSSQELVALVRAGRERL